MRLPRFDGIKLKSPSQIEAMKEAGRLSAQALEAVGSLIEPGITTAELDAVAESLIRSQGGIPAFKGYGGFPSTICASVNEVVVHGIPSNGVVLREGDIVSIDTGAIVDGWVGDNAATFAVGIIDDGRRRLLEVTEAALRSGIEQAVRGKHLGDIGHAVQRVIESAGMSVVRDYAGHGIGRKMHEAPSVLNYGGKGKGVELEEGMVLAIEPMAVVGSPVVETRADGWAVATRDRSAAAHFEHTVAVTAAGPVVLTAS